MILDLFLALGGGFEQLLLGKLHQNHGHDRVVRQRQDLLVVSVTRRVVLRQTRGQRRTVVPQALKDMLLAGNEMPQLPRATIPDTNNGNKP